MRTNALTSGAGWHQPGKRLRIPNNLTLLPLPPYSPELNPMENSWDYLRGNKLSRLVWDSYEAIVAACKDAWDFLVGDPERIKSIAHRPSLLGVGQCLITYLVLLIGFLQFQITIAKRTDALLYGQSPPAQKELQCPSKRHPSMFWD